MITAAVPVRPRGAADRPDEIVLCRVARSEERGGLQAIGERAGVLEHRLQPPASTAPPWHIPAQRPELRRGQRRGQPAQGERAAQVAMRGQISAAAEDLLLERCVLCSRHQQACSVRQATDVSEMVVQPLQLVHQGACPARPVIDRNPQGALGGLDKGESVGEGRDASEALGEDEALLHGPPFGKALDGAELVTEERAHRHQVLASALEEELTGLLGTAPHRPQGDLEDTPSAHHGTRSGIPGPAPSRSSTGARIGGCPSGQSWSRRRAGSGCPTGSARASPGSRARTSRRRG